MFVTLTYCKMPFTKFKTIWSHKWVILKRSESIEATRLEERTNFDLEMIRELGYCSGIENYSRYIDGRAPGTRPFCLLDYFPDDYLMIVDESHVTLSQVRHVRWRSSRKSVEYGF